MLLPPHRPALLAALAAAACAPAYAAPAAEDTLLTFAVTPHHTPAGTPTAVIKVGKAPGAAPLLPAPDLAGVPTLVERLPMRLRIAGNTSLRVQVASDAAFDRIAIDLHVDAGDEVRIPELADGLWHLRARRISAEGLEGLDGLASFEVRAHPEAPYLVEPIGGAKRTVGDVTLRWTENPEAASYIVEVARDAAFRQLAMHTDPIRGASALFHPVGSAYGAPDGVYFWRVASVKADGGIGPVGESQAFVLRPLPRAPLGDMSPDGSAVELMWGGRAEGRVQVELARDRDFREIVARGNFSGPRGRLARPATGTYYARYRFVEPDGFQTAWSDSVRITVDSNWHEALRAFFGGAPK